LDNRKTRWLSERKRKRISLIEVCRGVLLNGVAKLSVSRKVMTAFPVFPMKRIDFAKINQHACPDYKCLTSNSIPDQSHFQKNMIII
jgi:hypothetical protein